MKKISKLRTVAMIIACLVGMMAAFVGCEKNDPGGDSMGGTWTGVYNGVTLTLEINESAHTYAMSADGQTDAGTYDPATGVMTSSGDGSYVGTLVYKLSDDTLTLTNEEEGISIVFTRTGGGNGKDEPVSKNALIGSWICMDYDNTKGSVWAFNENGSFDCALLAMAVPIVTSQSYTTYTYAHTLRGKYRINGSNIECYDCKITSDMASSLGNVPFSNEGLAKILFAQTGKTEAANNFTIEFEFFNPTSMRIRNNRIQLEEYDWDFLYQGAERNIAVPTHRIPPAALPKARLSPEMPEFGAEGRYRSVFTMGGSDDVPEEYRAVIITVDRSSEEAFLGYCRRLRELGWSSPDTNEDIRDGMSGTFQKGVYSLALIYNDKYYDNNNPNIYIYAEREVEAVWPTGILGDSFRPPVGAVLSVGTFGSFKAEDLAALKESMESGFAGIQMTVDYYPETVDDYLNDLKAQGFKPWGVDPETAVSKIVTINGKRYEVIVYYDENQRFGTIAETYWSIWLED